MSFINISRFTPSTMPAEILEKLFVAREPVLDQIMERIDLAINSDNRIQTLLVGARGAGKTHLVSMVAHRTEKLRDAGSRIQLAWLPEDPYTVSDFESLLKLIGTELGLIGAHLESDIQQSARDHGPIVVIIENLDQVLSRLSGVDQQRLRSLLSDGSLLMVATSTGLSRDLSDQAVPFYGFFTVTKLLPFTVDQAAQMVSRIANLREDAALGEYLETAPAMARLQAISHLAGGAPRMWATLASALTVEELDDLVELLLTRFDDLTPYYQEQMGRLSPQLQRIVATIADLDRPVNVSELAGILKMKERGVASALSDLVARNWVRPVESILLQLVDKRKTFYELAEPMARLAFQLKASRGKPIRLMVEFLKNWFEMSQLTQAQSADALVQKYLQAALADFESDSSTAAALKLRGLPTSKAPLVEILEQVDIGLEALEKGDPTLLLQLSPALRTAIEAQLPTLDGHDIRTLRLKVNEEALTDIGLGGHASSAAWVARALLAFGVDDRFRFPLALWMLKDGRVEEAELLIDAAPSPLVMADEGDSALLDLAFKLRALSRFGAAALRFEQLAGIYEREFSPYSLTRLLALSMAARSFASDGQLDHALIVIQDVVGLVESANIEPEQVKEFLALEAQIREQLEPKRE